MYTGNKIIPRIKGCSPSYTMMTDLSATILELIFESDKDSVTLNSL